VLIVDDDEVFRNRLCRAFAARGWDALGAPDCPTALQLAEQRAPNLAIVDLRLPGMDGLQIVRELRAHSGSACIILLTGFGSANTAAAATRIGASHFLTKPADADQLLEAYERTTSSAVNALR
jgi:two-component system, response regulator RegA